MTPHTAASTLIVAALIFITFCYIVGCWVRPFGNCRRCTGTGTDPRQSRAARRRPGRGQPCRRCNGTGLRLRTGRRLLNVVLRAYRDGNH